MPPVNTKTWSDILAHVRLSYPQLSRGWFSQLSPRSLAQGTLTVEAGNSSQAVYLRRHCQRPFAEAAQAATGRLLTLRFESTEDPDPAPEATPGLSFEDEAELPLNGDYIFDNFVTGPCNRLAHAAAVAVSQAPGRAYNPFFIHGAVGLGKTHLLQAVCHQILETAPASRIKYISCESFTNHFLEAVEKGAMNQFRYRYRNADVLVIDDIHFLAERERSQEEFFHTFNTLHQSRRQIILSADCPPPEIPSLEERLVSRFNSGLVTLLERPCLETRMAIVRKKAKLRCLDVPEEVVRLIAGSIDSNIRELEGALAKMELLGATCEGVVDLEAARKVIGVDTGRRRVTIPEILELVGQRYNLRQADLQGKRRTKSVTRPRQICMYLARQLTDLSLGEIGGYLGGRDHTTVLHAQRMISERGVEDAALRRELEELKDQLLNRPAHAH